MINCNWYKNIHIHVRRDIIIYTFFKVTFKLYIHSKARIFRLFSYFWWLTVFIRSTNASFDFKESIPFLHLQKSLPTQKNALFPQLRNCLTNLPKFPPGAAMPASPGAFCPSATPLDLASAGCAHSWITCGEGQSSSNYSQSSARLVVVVIDHAIYSIGRGYGFWREFVAHPETGGERPVDCLLGRGFSVFQSSDGVRCETHEWYEFFGENSGNGLFKLSSRTIEIHDVFEFIRDSENCPWAILMLCIHCVNSIW